MTERKFLQLNIYQDSSIKEQILRRNVSNSYHRWINQEFIVQKCL